MTQPVTNHQLINQTSGECEYYTPRPIIEAARLTMGAIQVDPASSFQANKQVGAAIFFDKATDGLTPYWGKPSSPSTVWLNHPFGRDTNRPWIQKLITEVSSGRVAQACCITYACTSEAWFTPLLHRPQCFLVPRTNYLLPDGSIKKGVTKGSVVTYFGKEIDKFRHYFSGLGVIKI